MESQLTSEKKYTVSFFLEKKPYHEFVLINGRLETGEKDAEEIEISDGDIEPDEYIKGPFSLNMGQVAFGLIACRNDDRELLSFLLKHRCSTVYNEDIPIPVEDGSPWTAYLRFDLANVRKFIEIVLLTPPPLWAEGYPPSRRLPAFHLRRQTEGIMSSFRDVTIKPAIAIRKEACRGLNFEKGTHSPGLERKLKSWEKAWEKAPQDLELEEVYTQLAMHQTASWEYETDNFIAVAWLELYLMAERNITVRKCKHCRGYFVPKTSRMVFCNKCPRTYSRQALYQAIKWEGMSETEKAEQRKINKKHKRTARKTKKLYREGKSIKEIAKAVGKEEKWVKKRL